MLTTKTQGKRYHKYALAKGQQFCPIQFLAWCFQVPHTSCLDALYTGMSSTQKQCFGEYKRMLVYNLLYSHFQC